MGFNVTVQGGASEADWRAFLSRVRKDLFLLHGADMLAGVDPADLAKVPLTYQEDLYALTPIAALPIANAAMVRPRVKRQNFLTKRARYRRLQRFEIDGEWIAQTAGTIRGIGGDVAAEQIPEVQVTDANTRLLPDLAHIQRRLAGDFINLMLMLENPDFCVSKLAGGGRWRGQVGRRWQSLDGMPKLQAVEQVYAQWLPQYEELLTQGF